MSLLRRTEWCSRLVLAALVVSCTLTDGDDDDRPPICETCVTPTPEAAIPAEAGERPPDEEPGRAGFTGTPTGGRDGFGGSSFGVGGFGPITGGSFASGGSIFGAAGTTFGGFSSSFGGSAATGGF